jgi:prevent-host-death family protein
MKGNDLSTLTSTQARNRFRILIEEAQREVVQITQRNVPTAAVMSWEVYQSLLETLEILSDDELMAKIRRGRSDIKAGKTTSWDKVKKELAL